VDVAKISPGLAAVSLHRYTRHADGPEDCDATVHREYFMINSCCTCSSALNVHFFYYVYTKVTIILIFYIFTFFLFAYGDGLVINVVDIEQQSRRKKQNRSVQ